MFTFKRMAVLLSLLSIVVLTGVVMNLVGGPSAEAGGKDIKTKFAMTEDNPTGVPFPEGHPDAPGVRRGAEGTGEFKFDVNKNTFKLKIKAKDLQPNHDYVVQVTVNKGLEGRDPSTAMRFPQGVATTDKKGNLKFEINHSPLVLKAIFPDETITGWRIDFEVFDLTDPLINGKTAFNLVCRPATKIKVDPETGELILHGG